ncbi:DUF3068 domain-containing protein [Rhodococcus sp. IEGM 1379]|uniref:DUF3068 domain-containing protein n=1 Tax=Rhodococcus sp. IEGM 1379 TaxID=3047086 RepID=UPI0024B7C94A|nr:DUF3068 domain-containing protein [Rhodococcus sp. IEGM 1379]MDI9918806.1 DUF3068 domain-containing protein [Rhodococcus sp. IEGM 1379]
MAERSGPSRILPCILVGLGAFLLAIAVLIPTYMVGKLEKTPLDLEVTTIATGNGSVLNSAALLAGKAQVDKNVPIVAQRYVTTQDPSNADDITVQAGQTVIRTDKQGDSGLLTASVDTVTLDRVSSMPTNDPAGTIQTDPGQPAQELSRDGLQYKFPFNTEKKTYPYFDLNARATQDIDFVEETEINGMKVYHFTQTVEPVDLSKVVNSPTNKLTLPADTWGVPGGETPITMTRWYTNVRDLWVEPKTGVIVKGQEQLHQYYGRNKNSVDVDVLNVTLPFDEATIEYQIGQAKDGMDLLNLVGRTVPIIAGILGAIALIAGIFLGVRGGKGGTPAPAHGGGNPAPSGQRPASPAPGEHDWTTDDTQVIPRPDLRKD